MPALLPRIGERDFETLRLLSAAGRRSPAVSLVQWNADGEGAPSPRLAVLKDFGPLQRGGGRLRGRLGRWLIGREAYAYQRLAAHPRVPDLLARVGDDALLIEYRPGRMLSRELADELPANFLHELAQAVSEMHRLGVVHLDLKHRDNVLLGEDGGPVLIDFASAVCFEPGSWLFRHYRPSLMRYDTAAIDKWRERLSAGARPSKRGPWRRLRRWWRSRRR